MHKELLVFESLTAYKIKFPEIQDWVNAGSPRCYVTVAVALDLDLEVQLDYAYSGIRIVKNGIEVASGKYTAVFEKWLAVDPNYYGTDKFLYIEV